MGHIVANCPFAHAEIVEKLGGLPRLGCCVTFICAKCKRPYALPDDADKRRTFVCDDCWEAILREAAEHIRIKVNK